MGLRHPEPFLLARPQGVWSLLVCVGETGAHLSEAREQEQRAFSDSLACWPGQRSRTMGKSSVSFAHGSPSLTLLFVKDEGRGHRGKEYEGCVVAASLWVPTAASGSVDLQT